VPKRDAKWPQHIVEISPDGEDPRNADPLATQKITKEALEAALERAKAPEKRTTSGVRTKAVRAPAPVVAREPEREREEEERQSALTPRLLVATLVIGLALGALAALAAGLVN
jgi:hypothetical protein